MYIWREIPIYSIFPILRPHGYYSHLSALYLNNLLENEPADIYYNYEQTNRGIASELEQSRIDYAFRNRQRVTKAITKWNDKSFWFINGKNTGNYGVETVEINSGVSVFVTTLERTLIDIVVRPIYSGGLSTVVWAFRMAKSKVSPAKLETTLRALDYKYPYYQSIGFYLEHTGYEKQIVDIMLYFSEFQYDFYLDYQIEDPCYDSKWRIYYPKNLLEK